MNTTASYTRAQRSNADREAFRWRWHVTLPCGVVEEVAAEWDPTWGFIVVTIEGEVVGSYEGQRAASSIAKAAKSAMRDAYGV